MIMKCELVDGIVVFELMIECLCGYNMILVNF